MIEMITEGANAILGSHVKKRMRNKAIPKLDAQNAACSLHHLGMNKPRIVGKKISNKEKAPTSKSTKFDTTRAKARETMISVIPSIRDQHKRNAAVEFWLF